MTYQYFLDNFLSKPVIGDQRLFIYDKYHNFIDSITTDISHYFVKNNCLVIKITNKNDLILSFESRQVAQQALEKLDVYRKLLLTNNNELVKVNTPTLNTLNLNMNVYPYFIPGIDYQLATTAAVLQPPKSRIEVIMRGVSYYCANPNNDPNHSVACYFSPESSDISNPANARNNDGDVKLGDHLYWIGSRAGFDLIDGDFMDFNYLF